METTVIGLLRSLAKRPQVCVAHPVGYATVKSYLNGLAGGLGSIGIAYAWEVYSLAAEARGWDPRGSVGIIRDFTAKGLPEEEIVSELIAVETAAYAAALARLDRPT